jgi:hypothetical protein
MLDRVVLVMLAIPIAVFANVVRITGVAMADVHFGKIHHEQVDKLLGWPMMPVALILLWVALKFFRLLLPVVAEEAPLTVPLSPWLERAQQGAVAALPSKGFPTKGSSGKTLWS